MSLLTEKKQDALALRQQGAGYGLIARTLGVSRTTARRLVDPACAERMRVTSREAKRRVAGTCEECGARTHYHGGPGIRVSRLCSDCGSDLGGRLERERMRGKGPVELAALAYIGDGERRFMEIARALGITKGHMGVLAHRMVRYGILERPRRGVYRKASA